MDKFHGDKNKCKVMSVRGVKNYHQWESFYDIVWNGLYFSSGVTNVVMNSPPLWTTHFEIIFNLKHQFKLKCLVFLS